MCTSGSLQGLGLGAKASDRRAFGMAMFVTVVGASRNMRTTKGSYFPETHLSAGTYLECLPTFSQLRLSAMYPEYRASVKS